MRFMEKEKKEEKLVYVWIDKKTYVTVPESKAATARERFLQRVEETRPKAHYSGSKYDNLQEVMDRCCHNKIECTLKHAPCDGDCTKIRNYLRIKNKKKKNEKLD